MPENDITVPSLESVMRSVLERSTSSDSADLVSEVMAVIHPDLYERYLREAVVSRMSSVMGHLRGQATPAIRRGLSTKQSLIRDEYWPKFLQQRISTPDGFKTLAEATVDDLRFVAGVRRTQANELQERAEQFDALADLMVKAKVKHLEQLDRSSASRVIGVAA